MRVGQKSAGEGVEATVAAAPPVMEYDPVTQIVTIDGYRFTRLLFRFITTFPPGIWLKIVSRADGVITFSQKREPLEVAAPDLLAALKALSDIEGDRIQGRPRTLREVVDALDAANKAIALAERGA